MKKLIQLYVLLFMVSAFSEQSSTTENTHWFSLTLDNDIFVGSDSGYTNGLYLSFYEANEAGSLTMPLLTRWLDTTIAQQTPTLTYNASTFGQVIVTPSDITALELNPNDTPYAGLAFFHQVNIQDFRTFADKTSVTIGIIGPSSGAESTQEYVHDITGSKQPKGWDNQLKDEIVFQLSRGRVWKIWHTDDHNFDWLSGGNLKLGTLESSANLGMAFRFGNNMRNTYSSVLLNDDRTTNPININKGWYFYAAVGASYIGNLIYLDGNTFRDSPSVNYERVQLNGHFGFTYAFNGFSLSVARNNIDLQAGRNSLARQKEYGSVTFLWRLD